MEKAKLIHTQVADALYANDMKEYIMFMVYTQDPFHPDPDRPFDMKDFYETASGYLACIENNGGIDLNIQFDKCDNCGNNTWCINEHTSVNICKRCGLVVPVDILSHEKKVKYSKNSHPQNYLQKQLTKLVQINSKIAIDPRLKKIKKQAIRPFEISNIKKVVKSLKYKDLLPEVSSIFAILSHQSPPTLKAQDRHRIQIAFKQYERTLRQVSDRKSNLNYHFVIYKIVQTLFPKESPIQRITDFICLPAATTLANHNNIWKKICEELDW